MPVISTRFPTTTRSTYIPSTTPSIGDTLYRRSSLIGSYRSVNGDDSTSSRFGTSVSKRQYTSTTSIPSSTIASTSSLTRKSIDRDYRSKPPLGSRLRSESRLRDLSLDNNGYHHHYHHNTTTNSITSNINNKTNYSPSQSLFNQNQSKRLSTSSLARSVATSGADLYEKYSVANYKPNCELSRSRSLTDSKLIDSISGNHHQTVTNRRATSKDRNITTSGSLLAGSASTKDYLLNSHHHRSTSPITSTGLKVKTNDQLTSVVSNSLANSHCLYSNSSVSHTQSQSQLHTQSNKFQSQLHTHTHSSPISCSNNNNNNNNNSNGLTNTNLNKISKQRIPTNTITNSHHLKSSLTQKHLNNNNNDNPLSDSIVVSSSSIQTNNPNNLKIPKKLQSNLSSIGIAIKSSGAIKKSTVKTTPTTSTTSIPNNGNNGTTKTTVTSNGYKSINGTIIPNIYNNNNNNNNHEKKLMSSESFKRRLGTNPLSPYKNPDFLKCEYDLARSQVINSRSKSATGAKNNNLNNLNNNCNSDKTKLVNGYLSSSSLTSSPARDSNRNRVSTSTTFGVGQEKVCTVSSASEISIPKSSPLISVKSTLAENNNSQSENMNIVQHNNPVDLLDDIKYIDSDESERRNSPSTVNVASLKEFFNDTSSSSLSGLNKILKNSSTLPSNGTAKKFNDVHANKYNTITNGNCAHQSNGHHMGNGIARKAVPEDMLSSASSSTSTLSAMTDTSTSSVLPKSIIKESHAPVKQNHLIENGDNVSVMCMHSIIIYQNHSYTKTNPQPNFARIISFFIHSTINQ